MRRALLFGFLFCSTLTYAGSSTSPATTSESLKQQRRDFQDQEIITGRPLNYIINPNDAPRIVWRDVDEVRRLGCDGKLSIRWFDVNPREADKPNHPGRWGAWITGTAPNGTRVERSLTFYVRPPMFIIYFPNAFKVHMPPQPGPIATQVWQEHEDEISSVLTSKTFAGLNDSEEGAVLVAGLSEIPALGRPPRLVESAAVRNEDFHLALKLKVLGLAEKIHPLSAPRKRNGKPAPALHEGTPAEAGVRSGAKQRIDAVCRDWLADTHKPFVTLVARHGVVITHEAFGDEDNHPITLDYRNDVFSITKTITAILFARFLDQGLIQLDDPVGKFFPSYPQNNPHVPTLRQCFTHTSGLSGHGDWGGARNPNLENIILNGIDALEPGKKYEYSGNGYELAGKVMEIVSGKSIMRLYEEDVFAPLKVGDMPMQMCSTGAQPTALQLATLGQLYANRGGYGDLEFFSPQTFEHLLPENLGKRYPGITEIEGIGMHWLHPLKAGASKDSTRPEDLIFSPHTIGHGSFSSCIFLVDLDQDLVVVQIRREPGDRYGEWSTKFFQAIADSLILDSAPTSSR